MRPSLLSQRAREVNYRTQLRRTTQGQWRGSPPPSPRMPSATTSPLNGCPASGRKTPLVLPRPLQQLSATQLPIIRPNPKGERRNVLRCGSGCMGCAQMLPRCRNRRRLHPLRCTTPTILHRNRTERQHNNKRCRSRSRRRRRSRQELKLRRESKRSEIKLFCPIMQEEEGKYNRRTRLQEEERFQTTAAAMPSAEVSPRRCVGSPRRMQCLLLSRPCSVRLALVRPSLPICTMAVPLLGLPWTRFLTTTGRSTRTRTAAPVSFSLRTAHRGSATTTITATITTTQRPLPRTERPLSPSGSRA